VSRLNCCDVRMWIIIIIIIIIIDINARERRGQNKTSVRVPSRGTNKIRHNSFEQVYRNKVQTRERERAENVISGGAGWGGVISLVVGTDNATTEGQSNDNVAKRFQWNFIQLLFNGEGHRKGSVLGESKKCSATECSELTGKWNTNIPVDVLV
jgi:hypothetical protein